jgi:hypothetical protein
MYKYDCWYTIGKLKLKQHKTYDRAIFCCLVCLIQMSMFIGCLGLRPESCCITSNWKKGNGAEDGCTRILKSTRKQFLTGLIQSIAQLTLVYSTK